ncbi:PREDICTED: uncharacterized protein LOC106814986 [Priapulus caudatus]|uniref:Uncharacterized protein LOC106814986 n=1 Tax=Priapulus caudatus TaxID=37621 RepID=A0ABM1ESQ7_PRICU|nr:PREDICTED: uncharacterized protein LOC106814986 [Priapulus caudatus]
MDNSEVRNGLERPLDPSYTNGMSMSSLYGVAGYNSGAPYNGSSGAYMNKAVEGQPPGRMEPPVSNMSYAVMDYNRHYLPRTAEHSDFNSFRNYIMSRIEQPDFSPERGGGKRADSNGDKQLASPPFSSAYGYAGAKDSTGSGGGYRGVPPGLADQLPGYGHGPKATDYVGNGHVVGGPPHGYLTEYGGLYAMPPGEHGGGGRAAGGAGKPGRYGPPIAYQLDVTKGLPPLLSPQQRTPPPPPQTARNPALLACFASGSDLQASLNCSSGGNSSSSSSTSSVSPSMSLPPQPSPVPPYHTPQPPSPAGTLSETTPHKQRPDAEEEPGDAKEKGAVSDEKAAVKEDPGDDEEEAMDTGDALPDDISAHSPVAGEAADNQSDTEIEGSMKEDDGGKEDNEDIADPKPEKPDGVEEETEEEEKEAAAATTTKEEGAAVEESLDPEKQFALAFEQAKAASMRAQAELTKRNLEQAAAEFDAHEEFMPSMVEERPDAVYRCTLCSYSGTSRFHFNSHMNTHFDHKCSLCEYTARTEARLKKHIRELHGDASAAGDGGSGGAQALRVARVSQMPPKQKVYRCKQCEFTATNKNEFWDHSRLHIKVDKMLSCPKCNFVTEYKHHLEYHLRNHFGSKPFKCSKCNYSCVNKSMLNSHMKSHSNFYQYRCQDCTYATKYCHSLKLHLRKYGHKPATVLSGGDMFVLQHPELLLGRRGARGPKKKMFGLPELPPAMMNGGMRHPPFGFPIPPGFNGLPPSMMGSLLMQQQHKPSAAALRAGAVDASRGAGGEPCLSCNLCDFRSKYADQLSRHMMLHAAADNQDLCKLYGISTETLMADGRQVSPAVLREGQLSPGEVRRWAQEAERSQPRSKTPPKLCSAAAVAAALYKNVEGVDKAKVLDLSRNHDVSAMKDALDQIGAVKIKQEPDAGGRDAPPPPPPESSLPEPVAAPSSAASPSRSRRKGKAYKLDRICMKLQKQFSPGGGGSGGGAESNDGYSSDSCGAPAAGVTYALDCDAAAAAADDKVDREPSEHVHRVADADCVAKPPPPPPLGRASISASPEYEEQCHRGFAEQQALYHSHQLFGGGAARRPELGKASIGALVLRQMGGARLADACEAYECNYCEISFKNCVMYTMHMGYHGYRDPFKCNMCGHQAEDKISFFLHIARVAHM